MLLRAGDWYSTIRALKSDVSRGYARLLVAFPCFEIVGRHRHASLAVAWVWAVGVGLHEHCSLAYFWGRGLGKHVEEVVWLEKRTFGGGDREARLIPFSRGAIVRSDRRV